MAGTISSTPCSSTNSSSKTDKWIVSTTNSFLPQEEDSYGIVDALEQVGYTGEFTLEAGLLLR